MKEETFTLQTMLDALSKVKGSQVKKRLIYNQSLLHGIGSKWVIAFFISLPIFLYVGIFNPKIFAMLGIAQAIIFFVVFLSMIMIMIVALTFINNNKVIRQITPSWEKIFPDVELKQILTGGTSPYSDFFKHYSMAIQKGLNGDELYQYLQKAFAQMKEENIDLLDAMNSARNSK